MGLEFTRVFVLRPARSLRTNDTVRGMGVPPLLNFPVFLGLTAVPVAVVGLHNQDRHCGGDWLRRCCRARRIFNFQASKGRGFLGRHAFISREFRLVRLRIATCLSTYTIQIVVEFSLQTQSPPPTLRWYHLIWTNEHVVARGRVAWIDPSIIAILYTIHVPVGRKNDDNDGGGDDEAPAPSTSTGTT